MFKGLEPQGNDYNSLQPSVYNLNFQLNPFPTHCKHFYWLKCWSTSLWKLPLSGCCRWWPMKAFFGKSRTWIVSGRWYHLLLAGEPKIPLRWIPLICLVFIVQVSNLIVLWKTYPVPCPTYNSSLLFLKRFHLAPLDCRRVRRWSYCVPKAVAILSDDSARDTFSRESRRVR